MDGFVLEAGLEWPVIIPIDNDELCAGACPQQPSTHLPQTLSTVTATGCTLTKQFFSAILSLAWESLSEGGATCADRWWCMWVDVCSQTESRASPLIQRLARELWDEFPTLLLMSDARGVPGGERQLIVSGIVPFAGLLPRDMASVFGKVVDPDGRISDVLPAGVQILSQWFEGGRNALPPGSAVVKASSSHDWPYPVRNCQCPRALTCQVQMYKRGAWAHVDLMFLTPDPVMTFSGELDGLSQKMGVRSLNAQK